MRPGTYPSRVSTRGRTLLGLAALGWVGAMVAIWLTAPAGMGDGAYTLRMSAHIYAEPAVFLIGVAAIPFAFWLADGRQRGRHELGWRLIAVAGTLLAVTIGAAGIRAVVHPPYAQTTCVLAPATGQKVCTYHPPRADATLARYGIAALATLLLTAVATSRAAPAPTTSRAPRGLPGR